MQRAGPVAVPPECCTRIGDKEPVTPSEGSLRPFKESDVFHFRQRAPRELVCLLCQKRTLIVVPLNLGKTAVRTRRSLRLPSLPADLRVLGSLRAATSRALGPLICFPPAFFPLTPAHAAFCWPRSVLTFPFHAILTQLPSQTLNSPFKASPPSPRAIHPSHDAPRAGIHSSTPDCGGHMKTPRTLPGTEWVLTKCRLVVSPLLGVFTWRHEESCGKGVRGIWY
ncbi:hypothetical protein HJG60_009163 [Phyllostomus discolor]|uniref:Uncharacterized protein n=1 Tax=Phyllostomus discolor TaxID=89673 RepID=A0A833YPZ9_9CHIR|nr:hypothetical protein HJG60_009163 [Phyllostomus discolor]